MSEALRVCIYCRVSTEEQSQEGVSLGAQEDRCRALAKAKGWTVAQVYVDPGFSGKNLQRPALQRLVQDARAGIWQSVVVWKLDRLSRRQKDLLYLLEDVCEPHHIGIQSVTEPFDTTTSIGRAMLGVLSVFAQLERETIVERVKMGRRASWQLGRWPGGKVPYGYQRVGRGELVPDPVTSPIVQELFQRAGEGLAPLALATDLNTRKIPPPEGGERWWDNGIRDILKAPVYRGWVQNRGDQRPGKHPALIDEALWNRVQTYHEQRKTGKRQPRPEFLVDGLLTCSLCGSVIRGRLTRPSSRPSSSYDDPIRRYRWYYACSQRTRHYHQELRDPPCPMPYLHAPKVDATILRQLQTWQADPTAFRAAYAQWWHPIPRDTIQHQRDQLQKQQAQLNARVERWYDAYEAGTIDPVMLRARVDRIRQSQASIEQQLAALPTIPPTHTGDQVQALWQEFQTAFQEWDEIPPLDRQRLMRLLLAGGTLYPDGRVDLHLAEIWRDPRP